jgi:hypothetical protein
MKMRFFGKFFNSSSISFLSNNAGDVIEQEERRNGGRRNPQQNSHKELEAYHASASLNSSVLPFHLFNSDSWSDSVGARTAGDLW